MRGLIGRIGVAAVQTGLMVLIGVAPVLAGSAASGGAGSGLTSRAPAAASSPATYHPLTPVRILDTRNGTGGLSGRLQAHTPATFQVTGRGDVPTNATAVTGNLTVVSPSYSWAVYVGPDPIAYPSTSTINFTAGESTGNGLTVALGSSGTLSATYLSTAGNTTDLVFDCTGYFTPDKSGDTYHPLTPARLLDTRYRNGLPTPLLANTPVVFTAAGRGGVPANAVAVTGNLTVVNETASWAIYLGPDQTADPKTSTINFVGGDVRCNNVTVALGPGGTLSATYMSLAGNTTDLVFDVSGYYTADATGSTYSPVQPVRLLDTRFVDGLSDKLSANSAATFRIGGRGGIPSAATAVTGNVTVVDNTGSWAVFVGPNPDPSPSSSTLNFGKGEVRGNGLAVALSSGGTLSATFISTAGNSTDLVLDVTGYFLRASGAPATWTLDLYDVRADRWQDPDLTACTATATESILNTLYYGGSVADLVWQPTTSYDEQETIQAFERANMTMLTSSAGTDPHGWRNALNYYGWGSLTASVYVDSAYASFDAATTAAVSALARYHKPVGILAHAGHHAQVLTGYEVTGDDPSTGSMNFTIVGVDLTDPLQAAGYRDTWVSLAEWRSGAYAIQFAPYLETDSPYQDPIDGRVGTTEWYGKWVMIEPVR